MSNFVDNANWKMPVDVTSFASLFSQKPKMLTDEVQAIIIKAYGKHPALRGLISAENDADAIEGSRKDNSEEVVTIIRQFAREPENELDFPLTSRAPRRQLRHAYAVVRRRAFIGLQATNAVNDQSATQAAE